MLEGILLPSQRVQNQVHIQWKLSTRLSGKKVEMRTAKYAADPLEHLWKKEPFRGKNLVGHNVLPPQNVSRLLANRMPFRLHGDLRDHDTQSQRHRAALIPEISNNQGIVAHQDDTLA